MNVHRRVDALRHMGRKRDDSRERCLWVILPTTLPVATPGAAIRQAVPFRLQACVRVRGCPAFIGSGLCVRDSAWIRRFPSTDSTTARSGGLTYSPTVSCVFLPQSGSLDTLNVLVPVGASPWRLRMLCIVERTIPVLSARADSVQWERCRGGGDIATPVKAFARSPGIGALPGGRVALDGSPSTLSAGKRFRHRWTVGIDLPVLRLVSDGPKPAPGWGRCPRAMHACGGTAGFS